MDGSRSEAATESKDLFLLNAAIDFAGHSHHYLRTLAISLFLQLPSSFVLLMDCRTLGAAFFRAMERRAEHHPNGNSNAKPDRDMPSQNSCNRTKGRSQRNAKPRVFRLNCHANS
ncbi:MAG TPA: hypothetical protein VNX60_08905 [Candidatus Acidoferrum sp.]|nr:hypothetical protein [Candidatus Acidoferrum sp.]